MLDCMSDEPEAKLAIVTTTPDGETEVVPLSRTNPSLAREVAVGALKGLASVFPFGGALNEVLFDIRGRVRQERFNAFVVGLGERVAQLEGAKVDFDYLRSEEFVDVLEEVLSQAPKTGSEAKRKHLQDVLTREFQGPTAGEMTLLYLDILRTITEQELRALQVTVGGDVSEFRRVDQALVDALVGKGLLKESVGGPVERLVPWMASRLGVQFLAWLAAEPSE